MSIQNTASLVVMAHDEGRAEASKEFLDLAKRMDGFLDHAGECGYLNNSGIVLWKEVRAFIAAAEPTVRAEE